MAINQCSQRYNYCHLDAYKVEFVVVEEDAFDAQQIDVETALLLLRSGGQVVEHQLVVHQLVLGHLKHLRCWPFLVSQNHHLVALPPIEVRNHNLKTWPDDDLEGDLVVKGHCEDTTFGLIVPIRLSVEPDTILCHLDDGGGVEPRVDVSVVPDHHGGGGEEGPRGVLALQLCSQQNLPLLPHQETKQ